MLNYIVASYYGMRQAIFFLISPVVVGVITYFSYEFIRRRSTLFYYVASGLLLVALPLSNLAYRIAVISPGLPNRYPSVSWYPVRLPA